MILDMNLGLGEEWHYDPYHIISNKRMESGFAPYIHHSKLELENLGNQDSWE
jgi:hypothetical protein